MIEAYQVDVPHKRGKELLSSHTKLHHCTASGMRSGTSQMRKFSSNIALLNGILLLLLSVLIILLPGCIKIPKLMVPGHIEDFVREYIDILRQADANQAHELLHQSLAESVDPNDFENLIKAVGSEEIDNITIFSTQILNAENGDGYVLAVMLTRDDTIIGGTIGLTEISDNY